MKLPPRKWYTLNQAAEKFTYEINHRITVEDMIHYLFNGYFLPYIHVKFKLNNSIIFNGKGFIDLRNKNNKFYESIYSSKELDYRDLIKLDNYCKLALMTVERPKIPSEYWIKEYEENLLEVLNVKSKNELNDDILDEFFSKNKVLTYGIDGLLGIKIESLYNGHSSIFEEMQLLENGIMIYHTDLFTPPLVDIGEKGGFYRLKLAEPIFISAEEIIIVYDDLMRIIQDVKVNLKQVANERENLENTQEKNKGGRPTPHKEAIIELAKKIYTEYPDANRESIAKAVLELVINFNYLNDQNFKLTIETMRRYLKENEIGKPKGKSILIKNLNRFK